MNQPDPTADGAPVPAMDGPALYDKLTAMFGGPLPWPPETDTSPATGLGAVLVSLIRDFLDPAPCRLDHHGYCQAHAWMCSGSPCPHGRARDVLAAIDSEPSTELRRLAVEAHDAGTQQPDTEAHANGLPLVKGNCPACRHAALFLGAGGYPTCSNWECPEPDAATTVLEQYANEAHPPEHAWRVETRDGEWVRGSHFLNRQAAVERYETANSTAPLWQDGTPIERRIVRETTTYTVEEPAAEQQQPDTEAWRCDAGFVVGGRCTKPAGHRDPHATAPVAQQPAAEAWDVPDARPGTTDYTLQKRHRITEQQPEAADDEETRRG